MDVAKTFDEEKGYWDKIMYGKIRKFVKIFKSVAIANTTFFVAFDKIVSIFDLISKMWVDHFIFEEDIEEILRNQNSANSYIMGVLLKSGKIKILESKTEDNKEIWYISTL